MEIMPGAFIVAFKDGKRLENIQEAFSNEIQNNTNTSSATKSAEDTIYKIQLLASAKKHSVNSLQKQIHSVSDEKIIETLHNNMYKYVIGNYNKKEDALKVLSEIRKHIPDAFIVKFKGNSRI